MARLARVFALTVLWSLGDCAQAAGESGKAELEKSFQVRLGHSAMVTGVALVIGFEAVTSDSRCPKGEVCVWEGDATVRIWLQPGAGAKDVRDLHTSSKQSSAANFGEWSVRLLALDPYPVTGRMVQQADYVVTLLVTERPDRRPRYPITPKPSAIKKGRPCGRPQESS